MSEENQNQGDLKLKQQSIGIGKDSAGTRAVSQGKSDKLAALSSSDNTSALQAVILERKLKYQEKPENTEPKTKLQPARLGGEKRSVFAAGSLIRRLPLLCGCAACWCSRYWFRSDMN